jgi:hypothetical protein
MEAVGENPLPRLFRLLAEFSSLPMNESWKSPIPLLATYWECSQLLKAAHTLWIMAFFLHLQSKEREAKSFLCFEFLRPPFLPSLLEVQVISLLPYNSLITRGYRL